jgi:predicted PurR-regulated permease PerM
VPRERRNEVRNVSFEIHQTLGRFLRRQLVLVALVAVATFLGLEFIFHLRYALPLAVATGLVEIIPFIGPVLAGSVAAIIAISQGGTSLMLGVIVFYFVVRQIEDQIVAPVVLGRAVELHPLIVIFSVLAGGVLFGVLGTLAAVPFAASIKVILEYWPKLTAPPPRVEGSPADQPEAS